jgi:hypothetical protein
MEWVMKLHSKPKRKRRPRHIVFKQSLPLVMKRRFLGRMTKEECKIPT